MEFTVQHLIWGCALGFTIHAVMKFTTEEGKFVDNFWTGATLRYIIISALFCAVSMIPMLGADNIDALLVEGCIAIGMAGGSVGANALRARSNAVKA